MRDLNPKWEEAFMLWTNSLYEPLHIKVYDYDRGMMDDYMGGVDVYISEIPLDT